MHFLLEIYSNSLKFQGANFHPVWFPKRHGYVLTKTELQRKKIPLVLLSYQFLKTPKSARNDTGHLEMNVTRLSTNAAIFIFCPGEIPLDSP